MGSVIRVLLVVVCLLYVTSAWAVNRYASPSGGGSPPCTDSGNRCTISQAQTAASSGDTIFLADGNYTSTFSVTKSGLTFQGDNYAGPHFTDGFRINASNTTVENIEASGSGSAAFIVGAGSGSISNINVFRTYVHDSPQTCFRVARNQHVSNLTVMSVVADKCGTSPANGECYYTAHSNGNQNADSITFRYNRCTAPSNEFLDMKPGSSNVLFEFNIATAVDDKGDNSKSAEHGMVARGTNGTIQKNVYKDCNGPYPTLGNAYMAASPNGGHLFDNNVFYNCSGSNNPFNNFINDRSGDSNGQQVEMKNNYACNLGTYNITSAASSSFNIHDNSINVALSTCQAQEELLMSFPLSSAQINASGTVVSFTWDYSGLYGLSASGSASGFTCTGTNTPQQSGSSYTVSGLTTNVSFATAFDPANETITCSVASNSFTDTAPTNPVAWQFHNRAVTNFTVAEGGPAPGEGTNLLNASICSHNGTLAFDSSFEALFNGNTQAGVPNSTLWEETSVIVTCDLGTAKTIDDVSVFANANGNYQCSTWTGERSTNCTSYTTIFSGQNCNGNQFFEQAVTASARCLRFTFNHPSGLGIELGELRAFESGDDPPPPPTNVTLTQTAFVFQQVGTSSGGAPSPVERITRETELYRCRINETCAVLAGSRVRLRLQIEAVNAEPLGNYKLFACNDTPDDCNVLSNWYEVVATGTANITLGSDNSLSSLNATTNVVFANATGSFKAGKVHSAERPTLSFELTNEFTDVLNVLQISSSATGEILLRLQQEDNPLDVYTNTAKIVIATSGGTRF